MWSSLLAPCRTVAREGLFVPTIGRAEREEAGWARTRGATASSQSKENGAALVGRTPKSMVVRGRYWVRTSDLLGVNEALYH
jgi:hypothetical protein